MPFNLKYKEIINKIKYLDIFNGESFKAIHIRNGDNILSLPHKKVIFNSICQSRILPIEIVINYIKIILIKMKILFYLVQILTL